MLFMLFSAYVIVAIFHAKCSSKLCYDNKVNEPSVTTSSHWYLLKNTRCIILIQTYLCRIYGRGSGLCESFHYLVYNIIMYGVNELLRYINESQYIVFSSHRSFKFWDSVELLIQYGTILLLFTLGNGSDCSTGVSRSLRNPLNPSYCWSKHIRS